MKFHIYRQFLDQGYSKSSLFTIFVLFLLVDFNNGIQNFYNIQAFHFRRQINPDFETPLGRFGTNGIVKNNLNPDGYPEYCCGDQSKFTNDGRTLLVNSASSFAEWWRGTVEEGECQNYGLLLPLVLGEYDVPTGGGYFYTTPDYIRNAFNGKGFNNYTEFPEFEGDGDSYSFCWKTELDYKFMPGGNNVGTISAIFPGEILIYIDGVLKLSRVGTTTPGNQLISVLGEQDKTYHVDIFGCDRARNSLWEINIRFFDLMTSCDVNKCGTCGYSVCPEMCDNAISCNNLNQQCGSCIDEGPKDCEIQNNGIEPCVTYTCVEGIGCTPQHIPNCECNSTNCVSDDYCFPAVCVGSLCVNKPLDCITFLENCDNAQCTNGECICIHNLTPLPITTTSTTSLTTSSTISLTTSTTSGIIITPFPNNITTQTSLTTTPLYSTTTTVSQTSLTTTPPYSTTATVSQTSLTTTPLYSTTATVSQTSLTTMFPNPTSSGTSTIDSTTSNPKPYLCEEISCPVGYYCLQLNKGYTCISSYFEQECNPEILKEFY